MMFTIPPSDKDSILAIHPQKEFTPRRPVGFAHAVFESGIKLDENRDLEYCQQVMASRIFNPWLWEKLGIEMR